MSADDSILRIPPLRIDLANAKKYGTLQPCKEDGTQYEYADHPEFGRYRLDAKNWVFHRLNLPTNKKKRTINEFQSSATRKDTTRMKSVKKSNEATTYAVRAWALMDKTHVFAEDWLVDLFEVDSENIVEITSAEFAWIKANLLQSAALTDQLKWAIKHNSSESICQMLKKFVQFHAGPTLPKSDNDSITTANQIKQMLVYLTWLTLSGNLDWWVMKRLAAMGVNLLPPDTQCDLSGDMKRDINVLELEAETLKAEDAKDYLFLQEVAEHAIQIQAVYPEHKLIDIDECKTKLYDAKGNLIIDEWVGANKLQKVIVRALDLLKQSDELQKKIKILYELKKMDNLQWAKQDVEKEQIAKCREEIKTSVCMKGAMLSKCKDEFAILPRIILGLENLALRYINVENELPDSTQWICEMLKLDEDRKQMQELITDHWPTLSTLISENPHKMRWLKTSAAVAFTGDETLWNEFLEKYAMNAKDGEFSEEAQALVLRAVQSDN